MCARNVAQPAALERLQASTLLLAEQEDQSDENSLATAVLPSISSGLLEDGAWPMVKVGCPRCNRPMHWNGRLKIFICDTDGFILGPNDQYVKAIEYGTSQNQISPNH